MGEATCIMQALQVYSQASGKELTPFQKQCLFWSKYSPARSKSKFLDYLKEGVEKKVQSRGGKLQCLLTHDGLF